MVALFVLLALFFLTLIGISYWISDLLLYARRQPITRTPADYDMVYEDITMLMFDFRSHGESQRGLCAGGLTEDQDVMGAVDYVFSRLATGKSSTPAVGLVGFGLGAAAALAAVGREKGGAEVIHVFSGDSEGGSGFIEIQPANVKRLRCVVAVQPATLGVLLWRYIHQIAGLFGWVLAPLVDRFCWWRGGYPLSATFLLKYIHEAHVPLVVCSIPNRSLGRL